MSTRSSPLRLGLLDTIPPDFYLAGEKTDPDKFIDLFAESGLVFDFATYRVTQGELPRTLSDCDAYLVTGSPCSVYDELPWIAPLEDFVRDCYGARQPLVGVCFGHQVVAQALGGKVVKAESGWLLGRLPVTVLREKPWMNPRQSTYSLHYINQDQVVALPADCELIGETDFCPNAMYTVDSALLCIQPHPEQKLSSMLAFIDYLNNRNALPAPIADQAIASFSGAPPDANVFGRWIGNFLTAACDPEKAGE